MAHVVGRRTDPAILQQSPGGTELTQSPADTPQGYTGRPVPRGNPATAAAKFPYVTNDWRLRTGRAINRQVTGGLPGKLAMGGDPGARSRQRTKPARPTRRQGAGECGRRRRLGPVRRRACAYALRSPGWLRDISFFVTRPKSWPGQPEPLPAARIVIHIDKLARAEEIISYFFSESVHVCQ
jgi:hypothetical protein